MGKSARAIILEGSANELLGGNPADFFSWYSNPTVSAVMLYEILHNNGFDITLEEVTGFGMSSWPSQSQLKRLKGKIV